MHPKLFSFICKIIHHAMFHSLYLTTHPSLTLHQYLTYPLRRLVRHILREHMPHAIKKHVFKADIQTPILVQNLLEDFIERLTSRIRHELIHLSAKVQNPLALQTFAYDNLEAVERRFRRWGTGARGVEVAWQQEARRIVLCNSILQCLGEVWGPEERCAGRGGVGICFELGEAGAVGHEARVVWTADSDNAGGYAGVGEKAVPCCVAAERDAEGEVLGDLGRSEGVEDVRLEVADEVRCIGGGAVVAAKHVLGVSRVS